LLAGCLLAAVAMLTTARRSPATVAEQRARLPPAAECADPVAGTWKAHAFYSHVQEWYVFTLQIRRSAADPSLLEGYILGMGWDAGPSVEQPPACASGIRRYSVREPARGSFRDGRVVFDATSYSFEGEQCGAIGSYLLDRFSGTLDPARQEFQSVLNADAPEWRDVPTVFRRIHCGEEGAATDPDPRPTPKPPAFAPPRGRGGCNC
jgi:hypothetical protein